MEYLVTILRYVAPVATLIILATCIISLFRNRPRVHKLARLIDQNNGVITEITHWETSIGKSKSNDIVLPMDTVTRFHAVIAKKRKEWVVTDTSNSEIGIMVNGEPVDGTKVIENGDIITIGNIPLKFECDEAISTSSKQKIRQTVQTSNVAYGVLVDVQTKKPVYLKKTDIIVGRGPQADIQINNQSVSGVHARIYQTSKGWAIADMDSHNGTKINGRYIGQPQLIFDEDLLTFGSKVFIFYDK